MEKLIWGEEGNDKVIEVLKRAITSKHLIPIIGTGFTTGTQTSRGEIPSVDGLLDKMIDLLVRTKTYSQYKDKRAEFGGTNAFQDIANVFWKEIEKPENELLKGQFNDYMECNFTSVRDFPDAKRKFLNAGWKYIYTLNYDDAIENNLEIERIYPYGKISRSFIENHFCLFKLHGDAKMYSRTGDNRYCLLSKKQYLESIQATENFDMRVQLETHFTTESLLFIGCGLKNELDLLMASEIGLQQKVAFEEEKNERIYVCYQELESEEISLKELLKLDAYGITHVILVQGSRAMNKLYQLIYSLWIEIEKMEKEDELEGRRGIQFVQLPEDSDQNWNYFFKNDGINLSNGKIFLPSFFTERSIGETLLRNLKAEKVIHVVIGTMMSGKTYFLLQLVRKLSPSNTYYLTSTIGDNILKKILDKRNCVFVLDEGVLSVEQEKKLFSSTNILVKNNSYVICAIQADDRDFRESYWTYCQEDKERIGFYPLNNHFDETEAKKLNSQIGKLHLKDYRSKDTILDFIFQVEDGYFRQGMRRMLPPHNILRSGETVKCMTLLVLAVEKVIPIKRANELGIDEVLYDLSKQFRITVQKDYLTDIELENDNSRYKFVNNSPYWVLKCLKKFAEDKGNHSTIANAYKMIVQKYIKIHKNAERPINQVIKQYFLLDNLQLFFTTSEMKNSLVLPNLIYEGSHSELMNRYHFLHQEAKCELRLARRSSEKEYILRILEKSYGNIERAVDLAKRDTKSTIIYTINHMKVTKALILTNYLLKGKQDDRIKETISVYYDAFIQEKGLLDEKFLKRDDLSDVQTFLGYVVVNHSKLNLDSIDLELFSEIHEERTGKNISFET